MDTLISKAICSPCQGTGINDSVTPSVPCVPCGGSGYVISSNAILDVTGIVATLNWIKNKIKKILKKLDIEEE